MKHRIRLIVEDWLDVNKQRSVYSDPEHQDLSLGDLHHGSVFEATIEIDDDEWQTITEAASENFAPVFYLRPEQADDTAQLRLFGERAVKLGIGSTDYCNTPFASCGCPGRLIPDDLPRIKVPLQNGNTMTICYWCLRRLNEFHKQVA